MESDDTLRPDVNGKKMPVEKEKRKKRSTPWNIGCRPWCKKYFWEGQALMIPNHEMEGDGPGWGSRFVHRFRRPIGMLIPACIAHFAWWSIMTRYNLWHNFLDKYPMTLVMILGSWVAGATSEGGGAVAYPVMTLALGLPASVARDFSMYIQASGMTCATFAIFFMNVQIEWHSIIFCTIGGILGLLPGFYLVDPNLTSSQKKMGFCSIWFTFAFALFLLNRNYKRKTYKTIPDFKPWKAVVLFIAGIAGGICTSFAGGGLDICSFSVLTLLFRVSEKTATPTSVVLMALNSLLGIFWRTVIMTEVSTLTLEYVAVSCQIVFIGTPLGSVIGSHFHRQVLAAMVYILDTVALVSAFFLVPQTTMLALMSVGIIVMGAALFFTLTRLGNVLMGSIEREHGRDPDGTGEVPSPTENQLEVDGEIMEEEIALTCNSNQGNPV